MITNIRIEGFKSLVELNIKLGRINIFIGANGSGKSNILEAIGVLGAAAFGRVDDETLLRRGVRPGVPKLYKTAFKLTHRNSVPHILFSAQTDLEVGYDVTLWNPLENPSPAWKFKTEKIVRNGTAVFSRTTTSAGHLNQEQGMAALETVKFKPDDPISVLMDTLRQYNIYCPNTPTLRGLVQDQQTREPVGLSGGRLPEAINEVIRLGRKNSELADLLADVGNLIDWAKSFSTVPSTNVPLSASAARSRSVIQFVDKFMKAKRNVLTGYDASEGALYILFCAVLALHPHAPKCIAVDNVDQALNPILAKNLVSAICDWTKRESYFKQFLLTAHNPAILDGLPLRDQEINLFIVERNNEGHTVVRAIDLQKVMQLRPDESWTLSRMWTSGLLGGIPNV